MDKQHVGRRVAESPPHLFDAMTFEYREEVVQRLTRIETLLEPLAKHDTRLSKLELWRTGMAVAMGACAILIGTKLGLPIAGIIALAGAAL